MPEIEITPRLRIHYLDLMPGDSPIPIVRTAVLLHGLGATCDSWALQTPALLGAGFRVLAPDARGFGKSTYPGGKSSIQRMAEDVAVLLDRLGIKLASMVGISMGGTLALQLALDRPDLTRQLVLANTFASLRPERPSVWAYFLLRFILVHTLGIPTQARTVTRRIFPRPDQIALREILMEQICQADPAGYRAAMRSLALFNVTSRLGDVHAPTLVITGERDTTVPRKNQQVLVDRIPGARQVLIAEAGHAVSAEKPEEFNRAMLDFLCQTT